MAELYETKETEGHDLDFESLREGDEFSLAVESLRAFSPGLLALNLAQDSH